MRVFTTDQLNLLQSPDLAVAALATFYLDEGTYRFCDDVIDLSDGTNTYIGASALASTADIKSGDNLAAEPVVLTLDGNRMAQAGISDPAAVLSQMLQYLYTQRRVDIALGFRYNYNLEVNLIIPVYSGKINQVVLTDPQIDETQDTQGQVGQGTTLQITLDSLAIRYNRQTYRTRSHADQQQLAPGDMFFSFVADTVANERTLYWGKATPANSNEYTPMITYAYTHL